MVGGGHTCIFQGYWECRIRQNFDWVSGLQVALANTGLAGELPARSNVVDERIVEGFSDLVADRGHVIKSAAEDSGRNIAGIIGNPAVLGCTKIGEVGVETEHAAAAAHQRIVGIEIEQERVGEQRKIEGVSGHVPSIDLVIHNDAKLLVKE